MNCHLPIAVQISVLADTDLDESPDWIQILCVAVHVMHVYMMEFVHI